MGQVVRSMLVNSPESGDNSTCSDSSSDEETEPIQPSHCKLDYKHATSDNVREWSISTTIVSSPEPFRSARTAFDYCDINPVDEPSMSFVVETANSQNTAFSSTPTVSDSNITSVAVPRRNWTGYHGAHSAHATTQPISTRIKPSAKVKPLLKTPSTNRTSAPLSRSISTRSDNGSRLASKEAEGLQEILSFLNYPATTANASSLHHDAAANMDRLVSLMSHHTLSDDTSQTHKNYAQRASRTTPQNTSSRIFKFSGFDTVSNNTSTNRPSMIPSTTPHSATQHTSSTIHSSTSSHPSQYPTASSSTFIPSAAPSSDFQFSFSAKVPSKMEPHSSSYPQRPTMTYAQSLQDLIRFTCEVENRIKPSMAHRQHVCVDSCSDPSQPVNEIQQLPIGHARNPDDLSDYVSSFSKSHSSDAETDTSHLRHRKILPLPKPRWKRNGRSPSSSLIQTATIPTSAEFRLSHLSVPSTTFSMTRSTTAGTFSSNTMPSSSLNLTTSQFYPHEWNTHPSVDDGPPSMKETEFHFTDTFEIFQEPSAQLEVRDNAKKAKRAVVNSRDRRKNDRKSCSRRIHHLRSRVEEKLDDRWDMPFLDKPIEFNVGKPSHKPTKSSSVPENVPSSNIPSSMGKSASATVSRSTPSSTALNQPTPAIPTSKPLTPQSPRPPPKGKSSITVQKKKKSKSSTEASEHSIAPASARSTPTIQPTSKKGKKPQSKKNADDPIASSRGNETSDLAIVQNANPHEWICLFCQYEIFCHGMRTARRKGGYYKRQRARQRRLKESDARRDAATVGVDSEEERAPTNDQQQPEVDSSIRRGHRPT
ncbi:uncharacterized protein BYT42DRAFT_32407 [Radiomyces spectabilis]|uniref:uncharacterized protein n=1 Tax=Radiomyces spectabilis TaxID=64574 RepID=UPI00221FE5C2|nr:uncharacterized protein BYT42DRAFT_32407 [Radiomyces spectabilis]KAI8394140.1 hypothetical protein BYT42DRAFT_32407 [Radiomyces spectabilis]